MELGAMPLGKEILPEYFVETEALSKKFQSLKFQFNSQKMTKKSEAFNFNLLTEIKKSTVLSTGRQG